MAVAPDLKGSRRELALVFADGGWRTANEAARAMGKPAGSIFGVLRRMHADGLLESDADPPTRGTQYRLTAPGHAALTATLDHERPPGQIGPDAWVVVAEHRETTSLRDFQAVMARPDLAGVVAWSASLGWGWLLVLDESPDEWPAQRIVDALEQRGFRCRYSTPRALLSGSQLRNRAAARIERGTVTA